MLDSLNAKERSYDNNTNGNNFTIRKVNLIFVFIVVVWIFFSNKYMIQKSCVNKRNGIVSSMDLVNIMNIGNELYSGLSSLSSQSYLLLTDVPEMIIVFNINYQLQYSPSYTGTIHGTCEVQDFNYCVSFANAMQALLGQNYNSFLLTVLSTTVGFYCNGDGKFKIYDSHGRDSYGMLHPHGTCVL